MICFSPHLCLHILPLPASNAVPEYSNMSNTNSPQVFISFAFSAQNAFPPDTLRVCSLVCFTSLFKCHLIKTFPWISLIKQHMYTHAFLASHILLAYFIFSIALVNILYTIYLLDYLLSVFPIPKFKLHKQGTLLYSPVCQTS